MKTVRISFALIFSLCVFQLFAEKNTVPEPWIDSGFDIEVVNLPDYPIHRSIAPSFKGAVNPDYISIEVNFPVGEVMMQIMNADNQIVAEQKICFEGNVVKIGIDGLSQGEYKLVLDVNSTIYMGNFQIN